MPSPNQLHAAHDAVSQAFIGGAQTQIASMLNKQDIFQPLATGTPVIWSRMPLRKPG